MPTHEEIVACAQHIYEAEGRPEGRAMEHWLKAESQLVAERRSKAGMLPAKAAANTARGAGWQAQPAARQPLQRN